MKKIPEDVIDLINNKETKKNIIYENELFIVVEDPKNEPDTQKSHHTAWCKKDLRSLLDIEECHIPAIYNLIQNVKKKYIFVHFPPKFWRLHIHFTNSIPLTTPFDHVYTIDDVIKTLNKNPHYYRENVNISKNN